MARDRASLYVTLLASTFITGAFTPTLAKQTVIIHGEDTYKPYCWEEDGEYQGVYVDIIKQAFDKLEDYELELKPVPWKRGLHLLESGDAFALFPPYYYDDRRLFISPYSVPILDEKTILVCRKEVEMHNRPNWPKDYLGLTFGQTSGYLLGGDEFLTLRDQGRIKISESPTAGQNLLMVMTDRIDCYINDELVIFKEINEIKRDDFYKKSLDNIEIGPVISYEQGYLAYSGVNEWKHPYKEDFVRKFDQVITQMQENGDIQKIIEKYKLK